ncbi:MAG: G8 domain-containing protein [Pirellulales bacterium]
MHVAACRGCCRLFLIGMGLAARLLLVQPVAWSAPPHHHHHGKKLAIGGREIAPVEFTHRSVRSGAWSDPETWKPKRVPGANDRVLISTDTRVLYDSQSPAVVRLVHVAGTLSFADDRDTLLNVGLLKVQPGEVCSENGFACDLADTNEHGEPFMPHEGPLPALEIGTRAVPIPPQFTARVRLHYLEGMDKDNAPALACCTGRMELCGSPLSRTWVKLGADVEAGQHAVLLAEPVSGWRVGDEVIVTSSRHHNHSEFRFRDQSDKLETETRHIAAIEGELVTLDEPLRFAHTGSGEFRSEIANLSRNVIVESADPAGVRGHTVFHQYSRGGIQYARLAHLGKENVLGRYAIHFHLCGDTMRGSGVVGAAIVDSHNRWITVHGTNHLLVRDNVGFRSVGHGYFLEDGTEVYNVFDRNLGVQAFAGRPLPKQVLPFDPNDGAAFWWANGRNTFTRNVACENNEYGFRYDSQKRSNFDSSLSVKMPEGRPQTVDIRTLPFYSFADNESHSEGLYAFVFADTDRVGPDTRHPHIVKNIKIWQTHYALRTQIPTMLVDGARIDHAVYGVYRPEFLNHVYRNLHLSRVESEPFNRGTDDDSEQHGSISVDHLTFEDFYDAGLPLIQMSDNNPNGKAESHFRNVKVLARTDTQRRAWVDRGGGAVVAPTTPTSVPVFLHDYFGPGRTAKIISTAARDFAQLSAQAEYRELPPLTGPESRVAEVADVPFPTLLDPIDDLPPATVITWPSPDLPAKTENGQLLVRGVTTDNGRTQRVLVNGIAATNLDYNFGQWEVRIPVTTEGELLITAAAEDDAGNVEQDSHELRVSIAR